ncbi:MAG: YkvA family protein [Burkholderiales bacterium]
MAIYFAARDPETPRWLRWFAIAIAAYALSPIDLIPDFIPVFGLLDDLLIVPLGIYIVIRYLPAEILERSRAKADALTARPSSKTVAAIIVAMWIAFVVAVGYWLFA